MLRCVRSGKTVAALLPLPGASKKLFEVLGVGSAKPSIRELPSGPPSLSGSDYASEHSLSSTETDGSEGSTATMLVTQCCPPGAAWAAPRLPVPACSKWKRFQPASTLPERQSE